jgi:hypothetical protein
LPVSLGSILYYFNVVQVPFFAETGKRWSGAIQKLVPGALVVPWGAAAFLSAGS